MCLSTRNEKRYKVESRFKILEKFQVWITRLCKVCKIILRKAYCTPSTCNKCRSYLLRHTQGEFMAENTDRLHFRGNFSFFKTTNNSSALVPLLHLRLGFEWSFGISYSEYESLISSAYDSVEYLFKTF